MSGFDSSSLETYLKFGLALIFVLVLIVALAAIGRRMGLSPRMPSGRNRTRRLAIAEIMPLDNRRRLVLIRRDEVEHLILLGPDRVTVIESGIQPIDEPSPPDGPRTASRDFEPKEPTL